MLALAIRCMALETRHHCPRCGEEKTFYRTASTLVHLGEKTKWRCSDCEYGYVSIDGIESDAGQQA